MERKQLSLFDGPPSPATDERAKAALKKKAKRRASQKAFFAGLAIGKRESAPNRPAAPSARLEERPEVREKVLALLCSPSARIATVARRAGVSERYVRELIADEFDRQRMVKEAVAITRALEREPSTRRAPRTRRRAVSSPDAPPAHLAAGHP